MATGTSEVLSTKPTTAGAPRVLDPMLAEFMVEAATTRRVLERVPADKLTWKPHEKSLTLGQLANHIAMVPGRLAPLVESDGLDVTQAQFVPPQPKDVQEILATFEQSVQDASACFATMSDEAALATWTMKRGDRTIFSMPRIGVMRMIMMSHVIHHRGQLSVYLRMLNVQVPSIYGPSADD